MNNSNDIKSNLRAFQLKGSLLTLTVLQILKLDLSTIQAQLGSLVKQTPDLFQRMPIVIDFEKLPPESDSKLSLAELRKFLEEHGLIPIGIRGGGVELSAAAATIGLPVLPQAKTERVEPDKKNMNDVASNAEPIAVNKPASKLITQPVRSGQQIYAKGGDLVILNSVSPGAEILADGNIHVYGALRGRALAGVNGDKEARIFCQKLDAELVSIAGHYWVNEDLLSPSAVQSIQIYLEDDRLHIGTF